MQCSRHAQQRIFGRRHQALPGCLSRARGRRTVLPVRAASAAASVPASEAVAFQARQRGEAPRPLPKPPGSSSLQAVLPYFLSLGLGDWKLVSRIALAMGLIFTSKLAGLAAPFFVKQAVDTLTSNTATVPAITLPMLSQACSPAVQGALFAVACFGMCDIIKHVCKEMQAPVFLPVTQSVSRQVTYHTFAHVLNLDVNFHLEKRTGRLSRILERGPRAISQIYRAVIFIFLPTALELMAVTTVLVKTFSPLVGGLVGATFLAYTTWSIIVTQMATQVRKQVIELDNLTTSKAVDALLNFETVTLFNNQKLEVGQFFDHIKAYQGATGRTEQLAAVLNAGQAIILALGMSSVMFAAVMLGRSGSAATAGDLVMIQGLLLQLWAPLQFLGWLYRELKNSLVEIAELVDILRTQSRIKDGTQVLPMISPSIAAVQSSLAAVASTSPSISSSNGAVSSQQHYSSNGSLTSQQLLNANGASTSGRVASPSAGAQPAAAVASSTGVEIELRNVHFGYLQERKILNGVSLRVSPGQSVAIVGPSGSGKSTILKLLTRQYDVWKGSLLLNGVEMRDLTLDSMRAAVAVVPQDTVLFNDTILENIRYGRPEASDEEVVAAAAMARLDEAVAKMPAGLKTMVGERGLKLSGGEKQRVAIARAFLRSPRLLICDEATSALDSATEAQIIESLESLSVGRTSIFVAHRLSTVKSCDKIIVLRQGRVAEEGSHAELMEKGGLYKSMWQQQSAVDVQPAGIGQAVLAEDLEEVDVESLVSSDEENVISGSSLGTRSVLDV